MICFTKNPLFFFFFFFWGGGGGSRGDGGLGREGG